MRTTPFFILLVFLLSCGQKSKSADENSSSTKSSVQTRPTAFNEERHEKIFSIFKKEKSAKILGEIEGIGGYWLYLIKPNPWDIKPDIRDSFKVDGQGKFQFEIEADDFEEFMIATRGNRFATVFLENGYELEVNILGGNDNRKVEFQGLGAELNAFWDGFTNTYYQNSGFDQQYQSLVNENDPKEFLQAWNKHMEQQKADADTFLKSRPRPPKAFRNYVYSHIKWGGGAKKLTYLYHKPSISKMRNTQYIQVEDDYYSFLDDYKLEKQEEILHQAMNEFLYSYAMDQEMRSRQAGKKARSHAYYAMKEKLQGHVRDAVTGFLLEDFIQNVGNKAQYNLLKELVQDYKTFADDRFTQNIERRFSNTSVMAQGAAAPDFTLTDINGKEVSLSDFRGKIVVIDFWGTWCPPCRRELPFSKRIEEKYSDNDDVVFMFVALERGGKGPWKKFIRENNLPGVHLYSYQDKQLAPYRINSVPRYVIVDRDGNLYDPQASRPSQNMEQQVAKALQEG